MSRLLCLFSTASCSHFMLFLLLTGIFPIVTAAQDTAATANDFDTQIAPLLAAHCLSCHGSEDPEGGLNLTTRAGLLKGGQSGTAFNMDQPSNSLLLQRILKNEMPPEQPLSATVQKQLANWIQTGAHWGTEPIDPFRYSSETRAGFDWWSLQPLPEIAAPTENGLHPIDAFVDARLLAQGLQRSPQADRRTLIRRLSFDLLGLPPDPADVTAFLADNSPHAWELPISARTGWCALRTSATVRGAACRPRRLSRGAA